MAADVQTTFEAPQGTFDLHRHPPTRDTSLRAWEGADLLVLEHLDGLDGLPDDGWLVVNDAFGALGVALHERRPQSWSDSHLAHVAVARNLERNGLPVDAVTAVPSTADPAGPVRVAVVKVPRTLAHLRDQLLRLRPLLAADAVVVGAGMTKHVHTSTIEAFEEAIWPTPTSRAARKARLLLATVDPALAPGPSPYPTTFAHGGIEVVNGANVFSRESIDLGTRVLLDHLPAPEGERHVVDLGCGNGVVGTAAALADPSRHVLFVDESYEAVDSALATFRGALPDGSADGRVGDVLDGVPDGTVDLVLCNPPFHAQGARVDDVARAMVHDAYRVLRRGGSLVMVANRHLSHHATVKQRFGGFTLLGSDPKFTVVRAVRR